MTRSAHPNMTSMDPRRYGVWADEVYTEAKASDAYVQMYALHIPGEEREPGRPCRATPIFEKLVSKGCIHTEAFGWERPKWFSPDGREEELSFRRNNVFEIVAEECRAVAERVGVLELSSFAKFDVTGPDAEAFLNRVFANRVARKTGGIKLAHLLNETGRIQTEATITRIADECFYILTGSSWEVKDFDALNSGRRGWRTGPDRECDRRLGQLDRRRASCSGRALEADRRRPFQRFVSLAHGTGDRNCRSSLPSTSRQLRGRVGLGAPPSDESTCPRCTTPSGTRERRSILPTLACTQ